MANYLKHLLRELRLPVVPLNVYMQFAVLDRVDKRQRVMKIRDIMKRFREEEPQRYNTLKYLIEISRLVVKFSACNLMVTYNVAVSFGPVIFRTRHLFREDVMKMGIYYDVMMRMINDFEDIFVTERPTFDLKSF